MRLLDHPRFRAAYDFLLLRAAAGEVEQSLADWWTEIQTLSGEARVTHVETAGAVVSDATEGAAGTGQKTPSAAQS